MTQQSQERQQKAYEDAADYDPCCNWIIHSSNKALRTKKVAGARLSPRTQSSGFKPTYVHKQFVFIPDDRGKYDRQFWLQVSSSRHRSQSTKQPDTLHDAKSSSVGLNIYISERPTRVAFDGKATQNHSGKLGTRRNHND
eukprot:Plantae.Rhodophyta-Palmaria_palmata.ctg4466.p1 GENE.Plantae.Rhodophyta-Palmaria_palmata.ctg4466~~Plantae.Rhodophyta-Palmaria_palmata.ctg4466.p1  ORF type:complete len:140 (-),score=1.90 Plantae.Rhodophyta-Palmaria_palmata.ctg4466:157-576(-)